MTELTLKLRATPSGSLDLSPLTPGLLGSLPLPKIARLRLKHGNRSSALADLFEISGTPATHVRLHGLNPACDHVGHNLDGGLLEIRGALGYGLGGGMRGGEIRLRGNAGDGVGAGMCGGLIQVQGVVGDHLGGRQPGQTRGMNDGTIVVRGDAGDHVGERMRRGLIVIDGDCGSYVGDRMIAGSIVILGQCGANAGAGMRRGSLFLAQAPQPMPATFNHCGAFDLPIVALLATHLAIFDKRSASRLRQFARSARWCGDMAHGGKGELFIPSAD